MTRARTRRLCCAAGASVVLALAAVAALLCVPAVASAAAPDFYTETIDEGSTSGPTWVEVVDVTGDGKLDLVIARSGTDSVAVRAGDGTGRFGPASVFPCGGDNPYSLVVAELTGDGVRDIAVANRTSHTVTVLKGLGAGVFTVVSTINVGTETIDVKALDLDGDGDNDLVATQMWDDPYTAGTLWLLYNNGKGSFTTVDMPLPYTGCTVMGVGDLNKDDAPDVVVGHAYPAELPDHPAGSTASVLLNDNKGPQFEQVDGQRWPISNLVVQPALTVGPLPQGSVFAHFNSDDNMDICITSRHPNKAHIFLGDGTGAFTSPAQFTADIGPYGKVPLAVDLDKDGAQDVVVCNYGDDQDDNYDISILMGVGNGSLKSPVEVEVGNKPHSVASGDLNGDGWPDLVVPNWKSDDVTVLLNMAPYAADNVPPQTTSSADSEWHTSPVNVTLTATDNPGGSGVVQTRYRLDGGSWQTYAGPFSVAGEGDHTLNYYSVDRMGNTEPTRTAHVKIDQTAPVTTSSADSAWHTGAVNVTLTATDKTGGSGVAQTRYRLDGGSWQIYAGAFAVASDGDHTLEYRSVDVAGNEEASQSAHVKVDATPPQVSLRVPQGGARYPQGGGITCDWTCSDATSGVKSEVAKIDGAVVAKGAAIDAVPEGEHTFSLTVTDVAGNERTVTADYNVTVPHPTSLTPSVVGDIVLWGKSATVEVVLTDTGSGAGIGGQQVRLESSADQVTWDLVTTLTTSSEAAEAGLCRTTVAPKARTYYRFVYEGDAQLEHDPSVSDPVAVQVRPLVGTPKAPAKVKARKQFKITGSLKPRFAAGGKTVKVAVFRKRGNKWVLVKSAFAVNSNSGSGSAYTLKTRLAAKGTYRFQATTRAMPAWPSSTSGFSRVTVVK